MYTNSTAGSLTIETLRKAQKEIEEKFFFQGTKRDDSIFKPMTMIVPPPENKFYFPTPVTKPSFDLSIASVTGGGDIPRPSLYEQFVTNIGYKIIENDICRVPIIEQVRFPKSKKKRMRKKWAKNPLNKAVTGYDHKFYTLKQERIFVVPPGFKAKILLAFSKD